VISRISALESGKADSSGEIVIIGEIDGVPAEIAGGYDTF